MSAGEVLFAVVSGLAVNECCDISPWAARKLVVWSARHRYYDQARADTRAEELTRLIDDRPGKLFKLITALGFAAAAIVPRASGKVVHFVPDALQWQPVPVAFLAEYEHSFVDSATELGSTSAKLGNDHPGVLAIRRAWCSLAAEVRNAAAGEGVTRRSWRRCLKRLRRVTGDERWASIADGAGQLRKINKECREAAWHGGSDAGRACTVPTDSTVASYLTAAESLRRDIRRLTAETSVPRLKFSK